MFSKWISWKISSNWLFQRNVGSDLERAQTSEHCCIKLKLPSSQYTSNPILEKESTVLLLLLLLIITLRLPPQDSKMAGTGLFGGFSIFFPCCELLGAYLQDCICINTEQKTCIKNIFWVRQTHYRIIKNSDAVHLKKAGLHKTANSCSCIWTTGIKVWLRQSAPAYWVLVNIEYQLELLPQTSTF